MLFAFRRVTGAHGRSCTCTRDALDVVSLLLDYMSVKRMATPAGLEPGIARVKDECPIL